MGDHGNSTIVYGPFYHNGSGTVWHDISYGLKINVEYAMKVLLHRVMYTVTATSNDHIISKNYII